MNLEVIYTTYVFLVIYSGSKNWDYKGILTFY